MTEADIHELSAQTAAAMTTKHPDYSILAARIAINRLYTETVDSFTKTIERLYTGAKISKELYDFTLSNSEALDAAINHTRDDDYTYFGYKTLVHAYLLRVGGKIVERP